MKAEISYEQDNSEGRIMTFKQSSGNYRIECDTMAKVEVPVDA